MTREGALQRVLKEVSVFPKLHPAAAEGRRERQTACVDHSCSRERAPDSCSPPAQERGAASAVRSPPASSLLPSCLTAHLLPEPFLPLVSVTTDLSMGFYDLIK